MRLGHQTDHMASDEENCQSTSTDPNFTTRPSALPHTWWLHARLPSARVTFTTVRSRVSPVTQQQNCRIRNSRRTNLQRLALAAPFADAGRCALHHDNRFAPAGHDSAGRASQDGLAAGQSRRRQGRRIEASGRFFLLVEVPFGFRRVKLSDGGRIFNKI